MKVEPIILVIGDIPAILIHNNDFSYMLIVDNTGTIHDNNVYYKHIEGPTIKF